MKKLLLTFLLALVYCGFLTAQEATFEKELIDYGTVKKGANGKRIFTFTNTGSKPLIITSVSSTCHCTVPEYPKTPIAPGAKAQITVKYDTQQLGEFNKSITVYTNGTVARKVLKIKGNVSA